MTKEDLNLLVALFAHEFRRLNDEKGERYAMTESEPVITLPSGRQVLQAVRDTLVWHQARGHRISIGPDSIVVAEPPIHPDALFILSSSHIDTAALLDEQQSHG